MPVLLIISNFLICRNKFWQNPETEPSNKSASQLKTAQKKKSYPIMKEWKETWFSMTVEIKTKQA